MTAYLRLIDTHTPGPRCDVMPLFADYGALQALAADLAAPFADASIDLVAGIDALGFVLGTAVVLDLKVGLLTIRKGGKLPGAADQVAFVDYTRQRKTLELRVGAIKPGLRLLIVDEWIETGAQINAAISLIEKQGGIIAGIATINIDDNPATRALRERYRCHAVWRES